MCGSGALVGRARGYAAATFRGWDYGESQNAQQLTASHSHLLLERWAAVLGCQMPRAHADGPLCGESQVSQE